MELRQSTKGKGNTLFWLFLGRFKNEVGEKYHLMPIAWKTASGFEPGKMDGSRFELVRVARSSYWPVL